MIHVGKLVKTTATTCGVTLKELSRRLGVSQSTVENYVKRSSMDVEILQRISDVLEVNLIDRYLQGNDNPGFLVVTKELREARAEIHNVQLELEQLACENLLLKEEISKMRTALNRNSKLPVLTDLNTTTRTRAQTIYS
jgi:transcriptional regulator with XRE-family HTH domain